MIVEVRAGVNVASVGGMNNSDIGLSGLAERSSGLLVDRKRLLWPLFGENRSAFPLEVTTSTQKTAAGDQLLPYLCRPLRSLRNSGRNASNKRSFSM